MDAKFACRCIRRALTKIGHTEDNGAWNAAMRAMSKDHGVDIGEMIAVALHYKLVPSNWVCTKLRNSDSLILVNPKKRNPPKPISERRSFNNTISYLLAEEAFNLNQEIKEQHVSKNRQ